MSILTPEASQVQTDLAADLTPGAFAFADAENSTKLAMADFADTKAKFGAKAALALFNLRVSRCANPATNTRPAKVAWTLRSAMKGATHSWRISVNGIYARPQGKAGQGRAGIAPRAVGL